jgi:hypothetical protein
MGSAQTERRLCRDEHGDSLVIAGVDGAIW